MITRTAVIVLALLTLLAVPAMAEEGLEEVLEATVEADYHGVGVIVCTWGEDSAGGTYEVTRVGGMSMTHGPGGDLMVTGATTAVRTGDEWYSVEFADRSEWSLSGRYRLGPVRETVHLGRPAREYRVFEGEQVRVRLVVDSASTVPMLTEVFDGQGGVFRTAALVEFTDTPEPMASMPGAMRTQAVLSVAASPHLPAEVAGYRLIDTYAVPGGGLQAYYSDGLFSFSVFESGRGATPTAFDGATRWTVDGHRYRRVLTATQTWLHWSAPDRSYVMVGDLPPDHIAAVVAELPAPGNRGLLVRWWRRLFG